MNQRGVAPGLLFGAVLCLVAGGRQPVAAAEPAAAPCYELRVYTAAPDKLEALHARFRDHTCRLFEKHGMTNLGYFVPTDNPDQRLVYMLGFADRAARNKAWAAFMRDPEWLSAWRESEKEGKLVVKVESTILEATDYSPPIMASVGDAPRIFELRTYTATPGNLERLHARFREHTLGLFAKHGMTNLCYWKLAADQKAADATLVYLLAHASPAARDASFQAFRDDPAWQAARSASEQAGGGSLTTPEGVQSLLLSATDYSPTH